MRMRPYVQPLGCATHFSSLVNNHLVSPFWQRPSLVSDSWQTTHLSYNRATLSGITWISDALAGSGCVHLWSVLPISHVLTTLRKPLQVEWHSSSRFQSGNGRGTRTVDLRADAKHIRSIRTRREHMRKLTPRRGGRYTIMVRTRRREV